MRMEMFFNFMNLISSECAPSGASSIYFGCSRWWHGAQGDLRFCLSLHQKFMFLMSPSQY